MGSRRCLFLVVCMLAEKVSVPHPQFLHTHGLSRGSQVWKSPSHSMQAMWVVGLRRCCPEEGPSYVIGTKNQQPCYFLVFL